MKERKCEGKVAKSKQWKKEELLPEPGLGKKAVNVKKQLTGVFGWDFNILRDERS